MTKEEIDQCIAELEASVALLEKAVTDEEIVKACTEAEAFTQKYDPRLVNQFATDEQFDRVTELINKSINIQLTMLFGEILD